MEKGIIREVTIITYEGLTEVLTANGVEPTEENINKLGKRIQERPITDSDIRNFGYMGFELFILDAFTEVFGNNK